MNAKLFLAFLLILVLTGCVPASFDTVEINAAVELCKNKNSTFWKISRDFIGLEWIHCSNLQYYRMKQ